jgi:isocitrate dehydrogenase (NAD+)
VKTVIAEAPHGSAPSLFKKNVANPLALLLAGAALVSYMGSQDAERASRTIYESALGAIYDGVATSDLGSSASTSDFTDEVINRVTRKLEVWGTLA